MNSSLTPNKLLRWLPMGGLPGGAPSLLSLIHLMADLCFVQCLAFLADPCWWKPWGKHDVWVLVLQYQGAELAPAGPWVEIFSSMSWDSV